jgi:hypothetical protein
MIRDQARGAAIDERNGLGPRIQNRAPVMPSVESGRGGIERSQCVDADHDIVSGRRILPGLACIDGRNRDVGNRERQVGVDCSVWLQRQVRLPRIDIQRQNGVWKREYAVQTRRWSAAVGILCIDRCEGRAGKRAQDKKAKQAKQDKEEWRPSEKHRVWYLFV